MPGLEELDRKRLLPVRVFAEIETMALVRSAVARTRKRNPGSSSATTLRYAPKPRIALALHAGYGVSFILGGVALASASGVRWCLT